ncbi:MAG: putative ABC transporter permease [Erysipelotrichaceae bacterium]|nr:putative ABC transporter permease [Erysipelotrichaceae bacterium]
MCVLIISFFIYAVAGWVWESLVCPILTHHPIHNSGFLNGPVVPIYGAGALAVSILFSPDEKFYSIFLEGAVVACVIEYATSYVMEKIYHRRWWDYSQMHFNLNGRICLAGFLVFGLFSVVCVMFIQPDLNQRILAHGFIQNIIVSTMLCTLIAVDFGITVAQLTHLEERLETVRKELIALRSELQEYRFTRDDIYEMLKQKQFDKLPLPLKAPELRILKAFPQLLNEVRHYVEGEDNES